MHKRQRERTKESQHVIDTNRPETARERERGADVVPKMTRQGKEGQRESETKQAAKQ